MDESKFNYIPFWTRFIFPALCLYAGTIISTYAWEHINLPFSNPSGARGILPALQYHPANNAARFLVFIILPSILFMSCRLLFPKLRINQKLKDVVVPPVRLLSLFFLLLIAIVTALNVPTFHASDDFHHLHEGEALSATSGYEAGLVPYRDILPVHGVIQDIFRIKLGFFLFGEGIGSARTVESVAKLIAYALFIWLIYKTLNRNTWASVAIFLFLNFSNKLFFLPPIIITARDIPFLLFLLAIPRAPSLLKASNSAQRLLPLYLSACIVFGGLYSIDRGIYLVLIALFVIGVVPIVGKWDKKAWLQWMTFWIIGLATAGIFFVSVIGDGFSSLWNYLIFSVTEKNFLDGLAFPLYSPYFFSYSLGVALLCLMTVRSLMEGESWFQKEFFTVVLLLTALFLTGNILGRADYAHLAYSSWGMYIVVAVFIRAFLQQLLTRALLRYSVIAGAFLVVALSCYNVGIKHRWEMNFPFRQPNSYFLSREDQALLKEIQAIRPHSLLSFSAGPAWYYLLDIPSPTRFHVLYLAGTNQYEEEVLNKVNVAPPDIILFDTRKAMRTLDGISMSDRLPRLHAYFNERYVTVKKIGPYVIKARDTLSKL